MTILYIYSMTQDYVEIEQSTEHTSKLEANCTWTAGMQNSLGMVVNGAGPRA